MVKKTIFSVKMNKTVGVFKAGKAIFPHNAIFAKKKILLVLLRGSAGGFDALRFRLKYRAS